MYCERCGEYLEDTAIFCPACGHKVGRSGVHDGNIKDDFFTDQFEFAEKPKSRILAGVLAIVLGTLGAHDFYLGDTKKGIIKIALSIFSLGFISEMWSMIDAFNLFTGRVNTDFNGNPLTGSF